MEALSPRGLVPMSEFAGSLTQRIELWERSAERTTTGASSDVMRRVLCCLAAVAPDGAGNEVEAMSIAAMSRYRLTVRYRPDFLVGQQVRWRGRRLAVRQLLFDPNYADRLVMRCEEQR